jgi:prepilin-type N-terminal cleavage/methylation domain-containing protein
MHLPALRQKGFTLVELIVVIAILAILALVGLTVFQGQQVNARDSKRKADIQAIANSMESAKTPGATTYRALADNMFVSGAVPTDPINTNVTPNNACPGVCKYCLKTTAGTCGTGDTPIAPGTPAAVSTWTVCANLEAGGYYCRSNAQ